MDRGRQHAETDMLIDRRLIRFGLVGGLCYSIGFVLVYLGTEKLGLHYLASTALALILVNMLGWALNRVWTFEATHRAAWVEFSRYFAVNIACFFITLMIMALFVSFLGVHYLLAVFFTAGIMMVVNFVLHRGWSFLAVSTTDRNDRCS